MLLPLLLACSQLTPAGSADPPQAAPPRASVAKGQDPGDTIQLVAVADGFPGVTDLQFPPGSSTTLVVLQKSGEGWVVDLVSGSKSQLLDLDVVTASELGLLGLAFHPQFPTDPRVFVNYCVKGPVSRIAEFTLGTAGAWTVKAERTLLEVEQPYENHDAGQVAFGPDGFLYIGWGDGGSAGDPKGHGQNLQTLLGSMLRIDVDDRGTAARPYGIPKDNPFLDRNGVPPETWAYGLRNPWRFSFDPRGRMVVADVGQNTWEEIDVVGAGDNMGWNIREGKHCFNPQQGCSSEGLVDPIWEYGRLQGGSVTGGYVALADDVPKIQSRYIFGDFQSGRIWALPLPGDRAPLEAVPLGQWDIQISTFGRDALGRIYVGDYDSGTIYRVASL